MDGVCRWISTPNKMPRLAYLAVAQGGKPHGIKGEIKARLWTDCPERLPNLKEIYILQDGMYQKHAVLACRLIPAGAIFAFEGITTPEMAHRFCNQLFYVKRQDAAPLEEGAHYIAELEGCNVVGRQGQMLGVLTQVFRTGSNDVYEVTPKGGKPLLIPALKTVVLSVDIDEGIVAVDESWLMEVEDVAR